MPDSFDDVAAQFDALVDWEKRLATEGAFYRALFARHGVRRVLDAACGSGRHAALFHDWGLTVEGADLSARMIELARENRPEDERLQWHVRSFTTLPRDGARFDAVICTGNSLALAPDRETVRAALRALAAHVRPGGVLVVHVLNLWRLEPGPVAWQKHNLVRNERGVFLLARGIHRVGDDGFVEFAEYELPEMPVRGDGAGLPMPPARYASHRVLGLRREFFEEALMAAGASSITFLGDYRGYPYEPASSFDLIAIATY